MPGYPDPFDSPSSPRPWSDQRAAYISGQTLKTLARQRQRLGLDALDRASLLVATGSGRGFPPPPVRTRAHPKQERLNMAFDGESVGPARVDEILAALGQMPDSTRVARMYMVSRHAVAAILAEGMELERERVYCGHGLSSVYNKLTLERRDRTPEDRPTPYKKESMALRALLRSWEDRCLLLDETGINAVDGALKAWRKACQPLSPRWIFRSHSDITDFVGGMQVLGIEANAYARHAAEDADNLVAGWGLGARRPARPEQQEGQSEDATIELIVLPGAVPGAAYPARMTRALAAMSVWRSLGCASQND